MSTSPASAYSLDVLALAVALWSMMEERALRFIPTLVVQC
jgi:hypothetical protein